MTSTRRYGIRTVRLSMDVPQGMHRRLRARADQRGVSMTRHVAELVERDLATAGQPDPRGGSVR